LPQEHLVGSWELKVQVQPSSHWQRMASSPSTLTMWPHLSGAPQRQAPGLVLTVLQVQSGPQLQV
jgi:hypothetical protein